MKKFLAKFKTGTSIAAVVVILFGVYGYRKLQALAADPAGEKDCGPAVGGAEQGKIDLEPVKLIAPLAGVKWSQLGGSINDASCLSKTDIYGIVEVHSIEDITKTLAFARDNQLPVTTAGVRHSMGGQAFRKGGIVLDMRGFNRIVLNESTRSVTVQPGATWHDIQNALHPRFAVRAMQSTDIFSVGGSISVNAHGMDHQAGALAKSIRSMRVMLADGSLHSVSPTENTELFNLVVGGYGTAETAVIWLITQGRLATPRCASMRPRRRAITARESADGALRGACCLPANALPAPIARIIALTAPKTLGLSGTPFHEPFHGRGAADY